MMRRRRWVHPEFFTSEDVLALPRDARLTFIGLWLHADDFGRQRANAALIKASVWPLDDDITADVVEEHLVQLAERGMVEIYEAQGREYFGLTGWDRWQPVQNPSQTSIPAPPALTHARTSEQATRGSTESRCSEGEGEGTEGERDEGDAGQAREEEAPEQGEEGEGGRGAGTLPAETDPDTSPPDPFCPRHPAGTDKPCKACGNARLAFKAWEARREFEEGDQ